MPGCFPTRTQINGSDPVYVITGFDYQEGLLTVHGKLWRIYYGIVDGRGPAVRVTDRRSGRSTTVKDGRLCAIAIPSSPKPTRCDSWRTTAGRGGGGYRSSAPLREGTRGPSPGPLGSCAMVVVGNSRRRPAQMAYAVTVNVLPTAFTAAASACHPVGAPLLGFGIENSAPRHALPVVATCAPPPRSGPQPRRSRSTRRTGLSALVPGTWTSP